jgi:primosomal protein N' (replication factor Y)
MPILSLAMPVPLRRTFDYLPPAGLNDDEIAALQPGSRILAPFGNRQLVGILLAINSHSELAENKLKAASRILDKEPVLPASMFALVQWAASYYQHPLGDALANALPVLLRKSKALPSQTETRWQLSPEGKGLPAGALRRAAKQAQLLSLLQQQHSIGLADLQAAGLGKAIVKTLIDKGLAIAFQAAPASLPAPAVQPSLLRNPSLALNEQQQTAVDAISLQRGFACTLLEGVTGSGKTEVYLQLIERCLKRGQQALVLVPEIGLTPQTVGRFQHRFNCRIAMLNSSLTDRERLLTWQQARSGQADIIIGTRSAVFTPLARLGLIIIDEEHDSSFKQQEGFRYSARDIAIKHAANIDCPIVLGSATPSLESLNNALQGRYHHLQLSQRATGANAPSFELLDIRHAPMEDGFSPALLRAINHELQQGNQVLVFINRRGFSPLLLCHDCGYIAQCQQCDARMTVHFKTRLLRCHHCEGQQQLPRQCPDCNSHQLDFRGSGTERSEQALQRLFPNTQVLRIDRDTTSRKNAMQQLMDEAHRGEPCILVGTQMLAKGHHFADVTLVAVLDADGGLFSADFRGPEKMGQLLVQVAGRAGREQKPGRVLIQTHQPDHPLISSLVDNNYHHYARQLLAERQSSGMPPFGFLALIRADASSIELAEEFLQQLRQQTPVQQGCSFLGPLPAPMTRKAGRFRAQLILQSTQRKALHQSLKPLCDFADSIPLGKKVRWSVDVDPIDMF